MNVLLARLVAAMRSRPLIGDVMLALLLMYPDWAFSVSFDLVDHQVLGWASPVGLTVVALVAFRRLFPFIVLGGQAGGCVALGFVGAISPSGFLALMIGIYTASRAVSLLGALLLAGISPIMLVGGWLGPGLEVPSFFDLFAMPLITAVPPLAIGQVVRFNVLRQKHLKDVIGWMEEAQRRMVQEAAANERVRIARELHDVVAHTLGVVVVQASVARALPGDEIHCRETLSTIEEVARESLVEMRQVLGTLRTPHDAAFEAEPVHGLENLDDLVARFCRLGVRVELRCDGTRSCLRPAQDLTAYRIVQEGLINVLKHAGPVRVAVHVRFSACALVIDIVNDLGSDCDSVLADRIGVLCSAGQGLIGLGERLAVLGGRLVAGPVGGTEFRLHTIMPLSPDVVSR